MELRTDIRFIRIREVVASTGMSRASIYEAIKKGQFPAPVKLGARSSGWVEAEVQAWAASRILASRRSAPPRQN